VLKTFVVHGYQVLISDDFNAYIKNLSDAIVVPDGAAVVHGLAAARNVAYTSYRVGGINARSHRNFQ